MARGFSLITGANPMAEYALLADDGKLIHLDELGHGKGFDLLLATNGFDPAGSALPKLRVEGCTARRLSTLLRG